MGYGDFLEQHDAKIDKIYKLQREKVKVITGSKKCNEQYCGLGYNLGKIGSGSWSLALYFSICFFLYQFITKGCKVQTSYMIFLFDSQ